MPLISIILPSYRKAPYIGLAIKGVLAQSFSDWELIIIDDGLDIETRKAVDNLVKPESRIMVISNPNNLGIQKSLNRGLAEAKGKYIARIDDDDQWIDPDKLKKQVEFLEKNNDYVLVGTNAIICDENMLDLQTYSMPGSDLEIRNRILFKNCFLHSSVMIRKSALDKIGGYVESKKVRNVEDYDLWLRLGQVGKINNLDIKSTRIIVCGNTITSRNRLIQAGRDIVLTFRYRKYYPYFLFALSVGLLRYLFFCAYAIFPISNKVLYKLQSMYKAI